MARNLYQNLLKSVSHYLTDLIQKSLPQNQIKSHMLWLLDPKRPYYEDYLRMMGVAESITLEIKLLEKFLSPVNVERVAPYINVLNAYFAYETLSDNLAVGLATSVVKHPGHQEKKRILLTFNQYMQDKIKHPNLKKDNPWCKINDALRKVSVYQNTLAPIQMKFFKNQYLRDYPNVDSHALEYSYQEILMLNVETGLNLLNTLKNSSIFSLLKTSLLARYQAVTHLINKKENIEREKLIQWGTDSILTVPTLAYCIGVFDKVIPGISIARGLENGLLAKTMTQAALLTRLLNDIGTKLLTMSEMQINELFKKINVISMKKSHRNFFEFIKDLTQEPLFQLLLTRIHKDLCMGEFNIVLDLIDAENSLEENISQWHQHMIYFSGLYQQTRSDMLLNLKLLEEQLNHKLPGQIINNFVAFHETKYQSLFNTKAGDYAVTAQKTKYY